MTETAGMLVGGIEVKVPKTWKRETAWGLLTIWAALTALYFTYLTDAKLIEAYATAYVGMTWATFGFAASMFGIDAIGKQWKR